MKTYFIQTSHDISIDTYNEGQGDNVNFYTMEEKIKSENPREAIEKYFKNNLGYIFNIENSYIVHKEEGDEEGINKMYYDVLVDVENMEASKKSIDLWKEGKEKLYNDSVCLVIFELKEVKI